MKTEYEKIIDRITKDIERDFVTPTFGWHWPQYARDTMDKEDLIRIAWKQGRTAILLSRELEKLLKQSEK